MLFGGPVIPTPAKLQVDRSTCAHDCDLFAQDCLVKEVDGQKRLRNAVVFLRRVKQGKAWAAGPFTLGNSNCQFTPHVIVVPVKQDLTLINGDKAMHNIHSHSRMNDTFNVAIAAGGNSVKRKFKFAEKIEVTCDVHNWMRAWIFVAGNPYYALTGEDGTFTIGDIPAGKYKYEVWHEKLPRQRGEIEVTAGQEKSLTVTVTP